MKKRELPEGAVLVDATFYPNPQSWEIELSYEKKGDGWSYHSVSLVVGRRTKVGKAVASLVEEVSKHPKRKVR